MLIHSKGSATEKARGFTLIELLVVMAIIGLLSTVIAAPVQNARKKSRDARRIADLKAIGEALEQYNTDYGHYPQSACGWDCNGYRYSYNSSWNLLAADLAPYLRQLPVDPLNKGGAPWSTGGYTYAYGNVGRDGTVYKGYDLVAQLEDKSSPFRCEIMGYRIAQGGYWCGSYSVQMYKYIAN